MLYQNTGAGTFRNIATSQTRATLDTDNNVRDWVLPDGTKKATYDRKDPARVCTYCGLNFKTRTNKEKHALKCNSATQSSKTAKKTNNFICPYCSRLYKNKEALVLHAGKCDGDNCKTSPLGSITQEGQEVEVIIPDTLNPADPHTTPGLLVYSSRSRHLQSEERARPVNTQILMSEFEAIPEIQALKQRDETHEVNPTEEVLNLIDIEIDPLKEKGVEMDYTEDPKQVEQDKT